jgi:regulator of sirC expression with transglutaminase-like and TPR domain
MELDQTLHLLGANPSARVDVALLALQLAKDEYPDLDVLRYLDQIDAYADTLAPRLAGSLEDRTIELCQLLFEEEGFSGNSEDYYDPQNTYLNDVLDRKLGLPISLSLLAMAVGQRSGLCIHGVGLPGHFIAKACEDNEVVLFDPFNGGQILSMRSCAILVEGVTGIPFEMTPMVLAAASPGMIAVRMLTNLKGVYMREPNFPKAARVIKRLVQLLPGEALQRRDLGVCLIHADRPGAAIRHLQAYLAANPCADDAETIQEMIKLSLAKVAHLN